MTPRRLIAPAALLLLSSTVAFGQPTPVTFNVSPYTQNFDGITGTALPAGWGVAAGNSTTVNYSGAATSAGLTATALNGSSTGNSYVFDSSGDKAVGFLNSSGFTSPRSLVFGFTNNTGATLTQIDLTFNYEKYRSGSREFNYNFFTSTTGTAGSWTAVTAGDQNFPADATNTVSSFPPIQTAKSVSLPGLSLANGTSQYFMWTLTGVGGSTNGQAIGVDDFVMSTTPVPEPGVCFGVAAVGLFAWRALRRRFGTP